MKICTVRCNLITLQYCKGKQKKNIFLNLFKFKNKKVGHVNARN